MSDLMRGGLRRFLTFAFDAHYPGGGWADFKGSFDTIEDARSALAKEKHDFKEIIDIETGQEVE